MAQTSGITTTRKVWHGHFHNRRYRAPDSRLPKNSLLLSNSCRASRKEIRAHPYCVPSCVLLDALVATALLRGLSTREVPPPPYILTERPTPLIATWMEVSAVLRILMVGLNFACPPSCGQISSSRHHRFSPRLVVRGDIPRAHPPPILCYMSKNRHGTGTGAFCQVLRRTLPQHTTDAGLVFLNRICSVSCRPGQPIRLLHHPPPST